MNRLSKQSEDQLFQAFFELLRNQNVKEISIVDLCIHAGVSRKTFYRHFSSKSEIISSFFEKQFDRYIDSLPKQRFDSFRDVILFYFKFWEKYESDLILLIKNDLITSFLTQPVDKFYSIYYRLDVPWHNLSHDIDVRLTSYFFSGGLQSTYIFWLKSGKICTPEVIANSLILTFKNIK